MDSPDQLGQLTFRLRQAQLRTPDGRVIHEWWLEGPGGPICRGPQETYDQMERILKLAGSATQLATPDQLRALFGASEPAPPDSMQAAFEGDPNTPRHYVQAGYDHGEDEEENGGVILLARPGQEPFAAILPRPVPPSPVAPRLVSREDEDAEV